MSIASTDEMRIADSVKVDDAIKGVKEYAERYWRTLKIFDGLGGDGYDDPEPDLITLADVARLVVINGQPTAQDVGSLLDADASALADLDEGATLESCEVGDLTWTIASQLYEAFRIDGIGPAKRSKLLHAKRPGLFFINDSRTGVSYQAVAAAHADPGGPAGQGFWAAAREDILQDEFVDLMDRLKTCVVDTDGGPMNVGDLSRVRVLDIVCWSAST
ncbi:MAG: DUF6308 family protein [Aeromicrobium sp.]